MLLPAVILPALAVIALAAVLYARWAARNDGVRVIPLADLKYTEPKEVT
jgi:hypothetical protein